MAAWTLPQRIADWIDLLSAGLDQRSRKYLPTIILGMILSSGRRTVSSWLRAAGVSDDWQDHIITFCRRLVAVPAVWRLNCCIWL